MNTKLVVLGCCLCFFNFSAFSQQTFTVAEIREDMAFLKQRFEDMHPGMYYYTPQSAYDSLYQRLYAGIDGAMTGRQVYRYLTPLVTALQDGHTAIRPPKEKKSKHETFLPFYLGRFDDRFFVSYNLSDDTTLVRGTQLLTINDEPLPAIYQKLQRLYGVDDGNPSSREYYAERVFLAYYQRYYGSADSLKITFQRRDSLQTEQGYVRCYPQKELRKRFTIRYKPLLRKNFQYEVLDSVRHIAILDITSFSLKKNVLDFGQKQFKRQLKSRFARIRQDSIQQLIIDFRGNGGGFIPNISRLMEYIAKEPFSLTDTLLFKRKAFWKVAPWYTIFPPLIVPLVYKPLGKDYRYRKPEKPGKYHPVEQNHYDGNIYFLTDGGSYSATTFTLALANDQGIGTLIGQPPGGANWGSFAVTWSNFKLPNSRVAVHMPLFKIRHQLPHHRAKTFVLQPDYEVGRNFDNFMQFRDSFVDFTLDLLR